MTKHERIPRDRFTEFQNKEPIADLGEALALLFPNHKDSREGRYIYTAGGRVEIQVGWFIDGDSGGGRSGTDYYQIDPKVVEQLQRERLVVPRQVVGWGFTRKDHHRLTLSETGKQKHLDLHQEKLNKQKPQQNTAAQ